MTSQHDEPLNDDAFEIDLVMTHHLHRMLAGGAAFADIENARNPRPESWSDWVGRWTSNGEDYVKRARDALSRGHDLTAGHHLMSAAIQYHYAQYMMYEPVALKLEAAEKAATYFRQAAALLRPERIELAVDHHGTRIPAFLRVPLIGSAPFATVLIVPGLEASKEEMAGWEPYFLARGMATVVLDGIGQGELSHLELVPGDYAAGISTIVDVLSGLDEVDATRIGIMGPSLGGLLTSVCLATDNRFSAGVEVGGTFDTVSRWDRANILSKRGHQFKTKSATLEETRDKIATWTMDGLVDRIAVPFLIVHGEDDGVVPIDQSMMYQRAVPTSELVVVPKGNHVCNNMAHIVRPLIADWLGSKLHVRDALPVSEEPGVAVRCRAARLESRKVALDTPTKVDTVATTGVEEV